jgi:hypothetical protein
LGHERVAGGKLLTTATRVPQRVAVLPWLWFQGASSGRGAEVKRSITSLSVSGPSYA